MRPIPTGSCISPGPYNTYLKVKSVRWQLKYKGEVRTVSAVGVESVTRQLSVEGPQYAYQTHRFPLPDGLPAVQDGLLLVEFQFGSDPVRLKLSYTKEGHNVCTHTQTTEGVGHLKANGCVRFFIIFDGISRAVDPAESGVTISCSTHDGAYLFGG